MQSKVSKAKAKKKTLVHQFNLMSDQEKAALVLDKGEHLLARLVDGTKSEHIYSFCNFLVLFPADLSTKCSIKGTNVKAYASYNEIPNLNHFLKHIKNL